MISWYSVRINSVKGLFMASVIDTALSGLKAADTKLQTHANNIANQLSTSKLADGSSKPFIPNRVDQVTLSPGGVKALVTQDAEPLDTPVGGNGEVAQGFSNVDPARELVGSLIASYDFKANLKTIQVQDKVQQSLLDIVS